jgi:DNA-binding CsgD family transcriptional regulator
VDREPEACQCGSAYPRIVVVGAMSLAMCAELISQLAGMAPAVWVLVGHRATQQPRVPAGSADAADEEHLGGPTPTGVRSQVVDRGVNGAAVVARRESDHPDLTRRQEEIAGMIARGMTNKQIARDLFIAQRTAESHVENILTRLGFTRRAQIAAWYASRRVSLVAA